MNTAVINPAWFIGFPRDAEPDKPALADLVKIAQNQKAAEIAAACRAYNLTKKQIEVLQLTALGWTSSAISNHLNVSDNTVKNHKTRLFKALGVDSTLEAVRIACRAGLVEFP